MGLFQAEHCKACGCVLEKPEIERGWDVCFTCGYQMDGDFDNLPDAPQFEPMFPLDEAEHE